MLHAHTYRTFSVASLPIRQLQYAGENIDIVSSRIHRPKVKRRCAESLRQMRIGMGLAQRQAALVVAASPCDYSLWARMLAIVVLIFGDDEDDAFGYLSTVNIAIGGDLL